MDEQLLDNRIDDLCDNFHSYVNLTLSTYRLDTPARYFHIKTVERLTGHQDLNAVLDDSLFFDYLYATLVSWGMGSRSAILCGFDEFKNSMLRNRNEIIELNKYSIKNLAQEDNPTSGAFIRAFELLKNVLSKIRVSATESKLVANTKALHHLIPNLVPPVDRNFTLRFFFDNTAVKQGNKSIPQFNEVLLNYINIYERLEEQIEGMVEANSWNSSITKIIDNAIIGYGLKHPRPVKKKAKEV